MITWRDLSTTRQRAIKKWLAVTCGCLSLVGAYLLGVRLSGEIPAPPEPPASTNGMPLATASGVPDLGTGPDPDVPEWVYRPHQPRRANNTAEGRYDTATATMRITVEYAVELDRGDPLVAAILADQVRVADLYRFVVAGHHRPSAWIDQRIEWRHTDPGATVRFGVVLAWADERDEVVLESPPGVSTLASLVAERTFAVRVRDYRIASIKPQPVDLSASSAIVSGRPTHTVLGLEPTHARLRDRTTPPNDVIAFIDDAARRGGLAWLLLALAPWLVLAGYPVGQAEPHARVAALTRRSARIVVLAATGVVAVAALPGAHASATATGLGLILLPLGCAGYIAGTSGSPPPSWRTAMLALLGVVTTGMAVALVQPWRNTPTWPTLALVLVVSAGTAAGASLLYGRRWATLEGLLAGWCMATFIALLTAGRSRHGDAAEFATLVTIALPWALLFAPSVTALAARRRISASVLLLMVLVSALLYLPAIGLATRTTDAYRAVSRYGDMIADGLARAEALAVTGTLAIAIISLLTLRELGGNARSLAGTLPWAFGLATILCVPVMAHVSSVATWSAVGCVALAAGAWFAMLPLGGLRRAARLAAVTPAEHRRLVPAEARRRVLAESAYHFFRTARVRIGRGELTVPGYDGTQRTLDESAEDTGQTVSDARATDALATGAGDSPWRNACLALACAMPVAVALTGYDAWAYAVTTPVAPHRSRTLDLLAAAPWLLRWFGYALIFGYFYAAVRGREPVRKSLALAVIVTPVELAMILSTPRLPGGPLAADLTLAVCIRTGQLVAFCVSLALLWEWHLARSARQPWNRLRSPRRPQALATPVLTAAIAVATIAGTTIATGTVVALLSGPATPPPPPDPVVPSPVRSAPR